MRAHLARKACVIGSALVLHRVLAVFMFYRRKVLLALLGQLGRQVSKTDLQKYLFLLSQEQERPSYHFVPYRYGCYSFSVNADKRTMTKYGLVKNHKNWVLASQEQYLCALKPADRTAIESVVRRFKRKRGRELVRYVYLAYPYYAINSDILSELLDPAERRKVETSRPEEKPPSLYTIGYEGLSLEQFLNKLIENAVAVLCDVRRNAVSMKYGFSKRTLQHACKGLGIGYVHMPELGVDSSRRKHLHSRADYDSLFRDYGDTTLMKNQDSLESITRLVDHGSVALTCFEADSTQCHRGCVADALLARTSFRYPVTHL